MTRGKVPVKHNCRLSIPIPLRVSKNIFTMYASNMRSEWCGCMKSSSMACPNRTGTKEDFATYKNNHYRYSNKNK